MKDIELFTDQPFYFKLEDGTTYNGNTIQKQGMFLGTTTQGIIFMTKIVIS